HRGEVKVPQQAAQALLAALEVVVVTEAGQPARLDARLLGIDFPRMQIKDERPSLPVDAGQAGAAERIWVKPEVAAAGDGKPEASQGPGRQWEFHQGMAGRRAQPVRPARRSGDAIAIVTRWEDA